MENIFNIKGKIEVVNISGMEETIHNAYENYLRNKNVRDILGGYGNPLYSFIVDKGHRNGDEIHTITDNGVIIIQNYNTKKFITCLIAREGQIRRYFANGVIPIEVYSILGKCREYYNKGYNNW